MSSDEQPFSDLEATLKKAAAALRGAGVPFLLGGSLASWARGGPETRHDLDLMIKRSDVERAVTALTDAGMRADDPPEEWLVKAWDGDVLVDLIFAPKGLPIDDDVIARGEKMSVLSMQMRVMAIEDVLITKLMSLTEHTLRYESLLGIARALRERLVAVRAGLLRPARGTGDPARGAPPAAGGRAARAARQGRHSHRFGRHGARGAARY